MSNHVVIGLGLGDEGKGVVTEYLCSQDPENTIVVRFSGGQQAGHKVIKDDVEHIFSNFGSGTLSGCPTFWSKQCTFDPYSFMKERQVLKDKGVSPVIFIHPDCPITTIYDVFVNRSSEELEHGTTGTGFFRTKKRNLDGVCLTVGDLLSFDIIDFLKRFDEIREYSGIPDGTVDTSPFFEAVTDFILAVNKDVFVTVAIPEFKHTVFEGSQGLLLDEHIGTMPHCTPSDITPQPVLDMGYKIDEIFLVTRAYQTRHGNGPMTNQGFGLNLVNTEKETNVSHTYQGVFRTTILDLDQLMHAKEKGIDDVVPEGTKLNLIVTCMDQLPVLRVSRSFFHSGLKTFTFKEPDHFVTFIGSSLKIKDRFINDSPRSTSIKRLTCYRGDDKISE